MECIICKKNRFMVNMIAWRCNKWIQKKHLSLYKCSSKQRKNILKLKSIVESMQFSPEGSPLNNLYPKSFHIITVSPCCYFTTIGFITSRYWHQVLVSPCCYFTKFGNMTARYRSPLSQGRRFWENITSFVSQIKE